MLKAYITRSKYREEPKEERHILDVWFDSRSENAAYYETREEAESDAHAIFERKDIVIGSSEGGKHTLKNFRVEERGPREFVIFCEGPFIIEQSKGQSRPAS